MTEAKVKPEAIDEPISGLMRGHVELLHMQKNTIPFIMMETGWSEDVIRRIISEYERRTLKERAQAEKRNREAEAKLAAAVGMPGATPSIPAPKGQVIPDDGEKWSD